MTDLDSILQTVQNDIYQLQDERDSIRVTFNDLTMKIINSQVGYFIVLFFNQVIVSSK